MRQQGLLIVPAAHHQVATHPKVRLLHCDISSGNILVLPEVRKSERGRALVWSGILSDWEFSRPIDQPVPPEATFKDRIVSSPT